MDLKNSYLVLIQFSVLLQTCLKCSGQDVPVTGFVNLGRERKQGWVRHFPTDEVKVNFYV